MAQDKGTYEDCEEQDIDSDARDVPVDHGFTREEREATRAEASSVSSLAGVGSKKNIIFLGIN